MSKATTKKAISYAFKELLLEKPLSKITINDITEKCEMNRQTFYYHFQDIQDLIEWICFEDADCAIQNHKTYDTWQEGFLSLFELMKKDKPFIVNIFHSVSLESLQNYLYRVVYDLLYNVAKEKSKGLVVREDDLAFIANFYKYGFVGIVLEWVKKDMKEDPQLIITRLDSLIHGTIDHALENAKHHS